MILRGLRHNSLNVDTEHSDIKTRYHICAVLGYQVCLPTSTATVYLSLPG